MKTIFRCALLSAMASVTVAAFGQSLETQVASAHGWKQHRAIIDAALQDDRHVELAAAYAKARRKVDNVDRQSGHALALARWCTLNAFGGEEKRFYPPEAVISLLRSLRSLKASEETVYSLLALRALDNAFPSDLEEKGARNLVETHPDGSKRTVKAIVLGGWNATKVNRLHGLAIRALKKAPHDAEVQYYAALAEAQPKARLDRLLGAYRLSPERMSIFGLQQIVLAAKRVHDDATARKYESLIQGRLQNKGMWSAFFVRSYPQYR